MLPNFMPKYQAINLLCTILMHKIWAITAAPRRVGRPPLRAALEEPCGRRMRDHDAAGDRPAQTLSGHLHRSQMTQRGQSGLRALHT